ncbi:MAG: type I DNA topoisomerase [Chloroflexi bacterium]|nr:type I DNA topoisomerase [Chloroflexota bacterium]
MAKDLVIVESPTKARTIERILGNKHTVMASLGHVRDLPLRGLGVDVERNFEPSYVVEPDGGSRRGERGGRARQSKTELVEEIAAAAAKAPTVFLATDPDREGEAISWHLLEALRERKVVPKKTQRVVFHEITESAVNEAFSHPRDIDMDLVDAQQARRVLDRLVGYKLSPLVGKHLMYRGLTAGRVQSAALRIVVDRELEIEAFVPVESWSIEAALRKSDVKDAVEFAARLHSRQGDRKALTIPDEAAATSVLADLKGATFKVADVRKRPVKQRPSAPFITSTMQQEAWRKLRFSARKAMSVAQSLYEGVNLGSEGAVGLITYMRTDSTNLAASALAETRDYIKREYGERYVPSKPRAFASKVKGAQEAHEAIRPTSSMRTPESLKRHLSADQFRMYDLIWKRTVACQMADAEVERTTADIDAAAESRPAYLFRATGSVLTFPGFRALYLEGRDEASEDDDSKMLPPLAAGDALSCKSLMPAQHFTEPPPRFSEATLVRALEERGIGRPSTYAAIVSTIQERDYVKRDQGRLVPTPIGRRVNDFLNEHFNQVVNLDFTAKLEEELDEVAQGSRDWRALLGDFYGPFSSSLEATAGAAPRSGIAAGEDCDLCGKPMILKKNRWGRTFMSCSGFPECRNAKPVPTEGAAPEPAEPEITDELCEKCGRPMALKKNRWGSSFLSCTGFPRCKNAKPILVKTGVACPKCGGDLIERQARRGSRRSTFYGCANYPSCNFTVNQQPLTEPCPECESLMVRRGKQGTKCTNCAYQGKFEQEPEAATAEA